MTDLLHFIVTSIVANKEDVAIREEETETSVILHLTVNADDMGQVIGKQGRVVNAIREIIKTAGRNGEKRYFVEVDDN